MLCGFHEEVREHDSINRRVLEQGMKRWRGVKKEGAS